MAPYGGCPKDPACRAAWQGESSSCALPEYFTGSQYRGRPSLPMRREMVTTPETPAGGCQTPASFTRTCAPYPPAESTAASRGGRASSAAKAGEQDSTRLAAVSIFRKEVCMIRSCLLVSCARIVQRRRKAETSSSEARAMIFHRHSFFCQWDCFRCTGMSCCCRMRRTGQRGNSGKGRPGRCETPSVDCRKRTVRIPGNADRSFST